MNECKDCGTEMTVRVTRGGNIVICPKCGNGYFTKF